VIQLKKVKSKSLPLPYSNCNPNLAHRHVSCVLHCYYRALLAECGCQYAGEPMCRSLQQMTCDTKFYARFIEELYATDECSMKCAPRCERTFYELSTSFLKFPSENYAKNLIKNKDVLFENFDYSFGIEHLKQNMLSIHIYWKNLEYTLIEEKPSTTIIDLISNIGGILGKQNILILSRAFFDEF
jgi:hypothetical protein